MGATFMLLFTPRELAKAHEGVICPFCEQPLSRDDLDRLAYTIIRVSGLGYVCVDPRVSPRTPLDEIKVSHRRCAVNRGLFNNEVV